MVQGTGKRVHFRRRREALTNYKKRLRLLRSKKPRLVVRKSLKYTTIQIVEYSEKGDKILLGSTTRCLKDIDWPASFSNISAAYLAGYMMGKKALEKNISSAVLDTGLEQPTKGGKIFAVVKGMRDAGVDVPCDETYLPNEELISGVHFGEERKKAFDAAMEKLGANKEASQ